MKKNGGFTLIELLAVIVLIALLALVVVPSIINLITNNEDKLDSTTKKLIYGAAENYLDYNQTEYVKGEGAVYCISLQELIEHGFLEKDLKDITTQKTMEEWAKDGYGIKSVYQKTIFKNKFEYSFLTSSDDFEYCKNNEEYTPVLQGIAIGELSYYRYNTTDQNNKREKVYSGIDQMLVIVPVEAPNLPNGTELALDIRQGSKYIDNFTTLKTNLGSDHKASFKIEVPLGMKIGEYVIEVTDKKENKATKNLRIYINPIILFMGEW